MVQWVLTDRVDLSKDAQRQQVGAPEALMLPGDNLAHKWQVVVTDDGEAVDLSGASVTGAFLRQDGDTVAVVGSALDNVATVVLPQECYAVEGIMRGIMRVTVGTQVTTVVEKLFRVSQDIGDQIIDPGEVIPDYNTLLTQCAALQELTGDAQQVVDAAQATIGYTVWSCLEQRGGTIAASTGKWANVGSANYAHVLIPVAEGDVISMTSPSVQAGNYGFLTADETPVQGNLAPLVDGTSITAIGKGKTVLATAPATALYLYLQTKNSTTGVWETDVYINGVHINVSAVGMLEELAADVAGRVQVKPLRVVTDSSYFYVYAPTLRAGYSLRYKVEHFVNAGTQADGWVVRVVDLVTGSDTVVNSIVVEGEWEMAIKLSGRDDFIGVKNHGSEEQFGYQIYVDGVPIVYAAGAEYECSSVGFTQQTHMYDPADTSSNVGDHFIRVEITAEGVEMDERVHWLVSDSTGAGAFIAMLPIARTDGATQITDSAYDDLTFKAYDVSTAGFDNYIHDYVQGRRGFWISGASSGISASVQVEADNLPASGYGFVQNTDNYNKIYFSWCGNGTAISAGDVWAWRARFGLSYNGGV